MGIDLGGPFVHHIEATATSWPLCYQCSKKLQRPFPVEVLGLIGREKPKNIGDKCRVIVEVECHGERMTFELEHPEWWAEAQLHDALGHCAAFHKNGKGLYDMIKVAGIKRTATPHLDFDRSKYRG